MRTATGVAALSAGALALSVGPGELTTWAFTSGNPFPVIINAGRADEEHVYATAVSGDSLTGLIRGQDGTLDQPHAAGFTVHHGLFAKHIDLLNEFLSLPAAKGDLLVAADVDEWVRLAAGPDGALLVANAAAAGGVEWLTTLDGVTLTAPTIASFANAQHDHLDADDGGILTQAATHDSADTDAAPESLHHTLGTGANQATPGTHPAATGTHGVTGAIVGTNDVQTLTNKTLTAPVIADFTSAQHDHGDADDGGTLVAAALPASTPRGTPAGGFASITSNVPVAAGAGTTDVTGLSASFTATFGRRYKVTIYAMAYSNPTVNGAADLALRDGANNVLQRRQLRFDGSGLPDAGGPLIHYTTTLSGAVTLKASLASSTGTTTMQAASDGPAYIIVEDVGT